MLLFSLELGEFRLETPGNYVLAVVKSEYDSASNDPLMKKP